MTIEVNLMRLELDEYKGPFSAAVLIQAEGAAEAALLTGTDARALIAMVAYPGLEVHQELGQPPLLSLGDAGLSYDATLDAIKCKQLGYPRTESPLAAQRFTVRLSQAIGTWAAAEHEVDAILWDFHREDPLSVSDSLIAYANACAVLASVMAGGKTATLEIFAPRLVVSAALGGELTTRKVSDDADHFSVDLSGTLVAVDQLGEAR